MINLHKMKIFKGNNTLKKNLDMFLTQIMRQFHSLNYKQIKLSGQSFPLITQVLFSEATT